MVFSSIPFLFFFLPVFLVLYYLLPFKYKNYLLLLFSLVFYAWGEPIYILLMVFACGVDYSNGRLIEKHRNSPLKKKILLFISIFVNLSMLGFFKYADFLIDFINYVMNLSIQPLGLELPIGISFFTFQTMSYSIDVYRDNVKVEKNFLTYLAYVSMFPQLIAGPIVRFSTVNEELHERTIDFKGFSNGIFRFMEGLFKKVLIANNIGLLWDTISVMPSASVASAWLGAVAFTLQLYFDFSAYSDMAIGMGEMLGFHYLENFNYPLIARSVTDFWRRWHISLSTWFRDYLYIPLGGNRKGKMKQIRNILVIWAVTGLWHGAAWNFVLWGVYYGILLVLEKFVWGNILSKLPKVLQHLYTIFIVLVGFVIFVFDDFTYLGNFLKLMFGVNGNPIIDNTFLYYIMNYGIFLLTAIIFSAPLFPFLRNHFLAISNKKGKVLVAGITAVTYIILLVLTTSYLVSNTYNPFLYFRF